MTSMLKTANFTHARENLKTFCDDVVDNNATLLITRKNHKNVIIQSLENYNFANQELNNLKKEMAIYKRLRQAEIEAKKSSGTDMDIILNKAMVIIEGKFNV